MLESIKNIKEVPKYVNKIIIISDSFIYEKWCQSIIYFLEKDGNSTEYIERYNTNIDGIIDEFESKENNGTFY